MAYGESMKRLNPCGDLQVLGSLAAACPDLNALLDAGCGSRISGGGADRH